MRKLSFIAALLCATLVLLSTAVRAQDAKDAEYWIYFGTMGSDTTPEMREHGVERSQGIYVAKYNALTGEVSDVTLALKAQAAGYIATTSNPPMLYVVGGLEPRDGWSKAFAISADPKTGALSVVNGVDAEGHGACHVSVNSEGTYLGAANYNSGIFSVLSINADHSVGKVTAKFHRDGSGPLTRRQEHSYGHSSYFVEDNGVTHVFMSDLGADKVYCATLDVQTGALTQDEKVPYLAPPPGAGPRHLCFARDKNDKLIVFSINELDSTLSAFRVDFNEGAERLGTWTTIQDKYRDKLTDEESLVDGKTYTYGNKTAAIEVLTLANGRTVVYASNRGQDSIVVFDASEVIAGKEEPNFPLLQRIPSYGRFPRFFMLDPLNRHLVVSNKMSGSIYVYTIDQETGELSLASEEPTRLAWCIAGGFIKVEK
ncbi:MAG: lactonase family protein [Planctomycetia bacterium]|nr:lactonase family protein [Planctomycetia bacterium]